MAERYGPPTAFLLVDGYDLISNKIHTLTHKVTALQTKSDGLDDEYEEHTPVGVCNAEIIQEGAFFDTTALKSHAALKGVAATTPQSVARIICMGFARMWKGRPFLGFEGVHNEAYEVVAARGELHKVNATHKVSGVSEKGQIIQEIGKAIKILTSSIANPTVITTAEAHGIADGQSVRVSGHVGMIPDFNDTTYVATFISTTSFSIPVNVTTGGTRGTVIQYNAADWTTEDDLAVDYTLDKNNPTIPILTSSIANPTVITTSQPHGLESTQKVLIAGHVGSNPAIDGEHVATVLTTTTFTIPVNVIADGTGGTAIASNTMQGGYGYQQVIAFAVFAGFIGTIRDSPDDAVWSDLLEFADVTSAPDVERKLLAPGLVDRYLAYEGDVGVGAGTITVFCGFARS